MSIKRDLSSAGHVIRIADRQAEKEQSRQRDQQAFVARQMNGQQISRRNSVFSPELANKAKVIFA